MTCDVRPACQDTQDVNVTNDDEEKRDCGDDDEAREGKKGSI